MRSSTALLVRSIVSRLHPTGPATQRESRQLLQVLNGAFTKRLDEAHPAPSGLNNQDPRDGPPHANRSASTHFDSILQHPLFQTRDRSATSPDESRAIELFDSLLREGSLDMDTLRRTAIHHLSDTQPSHGQRRHNTRLSPRLAAWMAAASPSQKKAFFGAHSTVSPVLSVMFREGADATVWEWLQVLHHLKQESSQGSEQNLRSWLDAEDAFVSIMIRESLARKNPVAAAQHFVAASAHRAVGLTGSQSVPLLRAWASIACYVLAKRRAHGLSKPLFEDVLKHAPPPDALLRVNLSPSFLAVYKSDRPTATPLFHDLQSDAYITKWAKWKWRRTPKMQQALLTTILDASEVALQQNEVIQARFFLDFAQTHFPDIISREEPSPEPARRLDHAREELEQHRVSSGFAGLHPAIG